MKNPLFLHLFIPLSSSCASRKYGRRNERGRSIRLWGGKKRERERFRVHDSTRIFSNVMTKSFYTLTTNNAEKKNRKGGKSFRSPFLPTITCLYIWLYTSPPLLSSWGIWTASGESYKTDLVRAGREKKERKDGKRAIDRFSWRRHQILSGSICTGGSRLERNDENLSARAGKEIIDRLDEAGLSLLVQSWLKLTASTRVVLSMRDIPPGRFPMSAAGQKGQSDQILSITWKKKRGRRRKKYGRTTIVDRRPIGCLGVGILFPSSRTQYTRNCRAFEEDVASWPYLWNSYWVSPPLHFTQLRSSSRAPFFLPVSYLAMVRQAQSRHPRAIHLSTGSHRSPTLLSITKCATLFFFFFFQFDFVEGTLLRVPPSNGLKFLSINIASRRVGSSRLTRFVMNKETFADWV